MLPFGQQTKLHQAVVGQKEAFASTTNSSHISPDYEGAV